MKIFNPIFVFLLTSSIFIFLIFLDLKTQKKQQKNKINFLNIKKRPLGFDIKEVLFQYKTNKIWNSFNKEENV